MQRRRSVIVTAACAALIVLGACGEAGSATPPRASAGASATASTAIASTPADDGCSPDNSPTDVVATPGPAPDVAVEPQSESSPLQDIVVRRINCAGGWVNLRNEIPADRPVLVWFWAPY